MPRPCQICSNPDLAEKYAIHKHLSGRKLAAVLGIGHWSVRTHQRHIAESDAEHITGDERDRLQKDIEAQADRLLRLVHCASTDLARVRAEQELGRNLSLQARLGTGGVLADSRLPDASPSSQISSVVSILATELADHPELQRRIVERLGSVSLHAG